ncbi:MAG: phosphatase, partial [Acidimicrobiales bacterium]
YMESMLETLGGRQEVDAVIGDHGFAGAALEAGIPTYAIADANDPGLRWPKRGAAPTESS